MLQETQSTIYLQQQAQRLSSNHASGNTLQPPNQYN